MSIDVSFGGMSINDGVHKLPKDCYPPTESESDDGEDSFVVLNDPESSFIGVVEAFQPHKDDVVLSTLSIDRSLNSLNDIAQSAMNKSALTLPSTSSMSQSIKTEDISKPESVNFVIINGQELNLTQIQTRVQTFAMENAQLKDAIKQNNIAMQDQCEKIAELHREYVKSTEQERSKLRDSINKAEQLQTANDELKFVRNEQKKVIDQLRDDVILLNKSGDELKASKEALDKMIIPNVNCFNLELAEKRLKETAISLEESVYKTEMLQSKLNICETQSETLKMRHLEEIARLKERLVYFQRKDENYEENEIDQRKMTDQLTEMQKTIVEMTTKVLVLEQQVKIYKNDFEEEREARQKLKQDEDQLRTDFEFTRKLNDELKEENARLKTPNAQNTSSSPNRNDSDVYTCHWCQFGFFNLNALRNHIERCPEHIY